MRLRLSRLQSYAALLLRTRLPARGVERSTMVCREALLDGVEADARALQPRQPRHVRGQCAAQRALSGAWQAAHGQQAGLRLRHVLHHGAAGTLARETASARCSGHAQRSCKAMRSRLG
jgi:hypothetical protein